jgi:hypothetical protein
MQCEDENKKLLSLELDIWGFVSQEIHHLLQILL